MQISQRAFVVGWLVIAGVAACSSTKVGQMTSDITCHVDKDCPAPTICQVCNSRCVFAPNQACNLDAPCPCGYSCRDQVCVSNLGVPTAMCTYDRDCPVDQFCNRAQFQCEFPMELGPSTGVACTANSQCDAGDICTSAGGANAMECAPNLTTQCHTTAECPTGDVCSPLGQCEHRTC
jgi:hypothetical protein